MRNLSKIPRRTLQCPQCRKVTSLKGDKKKKGSEGFQMNLIVLECHFQIGRGENDSHFIDRQLIAKERSPVFSVLGISATLYCSEQFYCASCSELVHSSGKPWNHKKTRDHDGNVEIACCLSSGLFFSPSKIQMRRSFKDDQVLLPQG